MSDEKPVQQVPGQPALRQRDLWTMTSSDILVYRDLSPYPLLQNYLSLMGAGSVIAAFPTIPP
jgi:hypothetical protein